MKAKQFGRSMVEMLGVLAIIGVLSIGGLLGYRRAVNNHQANTILDDVNRFAFVILERSGLALAENIDRGDFVESGTYKLTGFQGEDAGQFSITVKNVPEGVCESLVPKALVEYKVGIVAAGGSRNDEVLYDTLNTDLCQENNDISFYFGDTSGICNEPDGDGPCTTNADCCGEFFCAFESATECIAKGTIGKPNVVHGTCLPMSDFDDETGNLTKTVVVDGVSQKFVRSSSGMTWWSAQNWCERKGMTLIWRRDLGCGHVAHSHSCTKPPSTEFPTGGSSNGAAYAAHAYTGSALAALQSGTNGWTSGWYWTLDYSSSCYAYGGRFYDSVIAWTYRAYDGAYALCH